MIVKANQPTLLEQVANAFAGTDADFADITSLPPDLAEPRHLAVYARQHWAIENREH